MAHGARLMATCNEADLFDGNDDEKAMVAEDGSSNYYWRQRWGDATPEEGEASKESDRAACVLGGETCRDNKIGMFDPKNEDAVIKSRVEGNETKAKNSAARKEISRLLAKCLKCNTTKFHSGAGSIKCGTCGAFENFMPGSGYVKRSGKELSLEHMEGMHVYSCHDRFMWVLEKGELVRESPVDDGNNDDEDDDGGIREVTRKLPEKYRQCSVCKDNLDKWLSRVTDGPEPKVHVKVQRKSLPGHGTGLCGFHFKLKRRSEGRDVRDK